MPHSRKTNHVCKPGESDRTVSLSYSMKSSLAESSVEVPMKVFESLCADLCALNIASQERV